TRERIRLVFEMARPDVNERRKPQTYRSCQQPKQQHGGDDIRGRQVSLMLEAKRLIKPLLTRHPRDRGERHKDGSGGNAEQLQYVTLFIMANFMRKHVFQFRLGELGDESIEQYDFSKTSEPGEEGVGVARASA